LLEGVLMVVSVVAAELSPMMAGAPVESVIAAAQVSGAHAAGVQADPAIQIPPAVAQSA
jgi:hypothetical protein